MTATLTKVARHLNVTYGAAHDLAGRLPPLLILTDFHRLPDPLRAVDRLPPECACHCALVLRHYELGEGERCALAEILRRATLQRGMPLLIADNAALAREIGADGVHLPEHRLDDPAQVAAAKKLPLATAATHSLEALRRAAACGVDAAVVSPIFATDSHPGAPALGRAGLKSWLDAVTLPIYALGGISDRTAEHLSDLKLAGLAGIGAFKPPEMAEARKRGG